MYRQPYAQNKWKQAQLLRHHPSTARHFPATQIAKGPIILAFLRQYPIVYIKPTSGGQGRNIIRVDRIQGGSFRVRKQGGREVTFPTLSATGQYLQRQIASRGHVIQQGIYSVTRQNLPFDIRVHMQHVLGEWTVGGMVGKVAQANQIVTNRHRGAIPTTMEKLLDHHLGYQSAKKNHVLSILRTVSLRTATLMRKGYPGWHNFGIDFGIDAAGKPWIYEINIYPGVHVFRALPDKRPIRQIMENWRKNRMRKRISNNN
ncbi:YheC/D like ATP-grasp [Marininema mesophilum]|uniref:YheC/D like ATP-grasp n=1 Tax=Marininema mesophilum TaxID=1048340 RepID=A0A1H3CJL0_9BACL|nr:YheC/YheD family protein [Marininema mesophilum]SDX54333.1 YheC/D like ATP-grasp [Marininema mesophilum]